MSSKKRMLLKTGLSAIIVIAVMLSLAGVAWAQVAGLPAPDQTASGQYVCPTPTFTCPIGHEGCTPGYWKNHPESWPAGYSPSTPLGSVFTFPGIPDYSSFPAATLMDALNYGGGPDLTGAAQILLRAAVAALLNAAHPDISYSLTVGQVVTRTNAALASQNIQIILSLASGLDQRNNAGCPVS